jgi:hypothetical protein
MAMCMRAIRLPLDLSHAIAEDNQTVSVAHLARRVGEAEVEVGTWMADEYEEPIGPYPATEVRVR